MKRPRFEVFPEVSEASSHETVADDRPAFHPSGDEYTVCHAHCNDCEWTAKGDPADTRGAAAAHEREHPKPTGEYGWRLRAANGEIIANGESYTRPEDAERACTTVAETVAQIEWVGPEGSAVSVERVDGE